MLCLNNLSKLCDLWSLHATNLKFGMLHQVPLVGNTEVLAAYQDWEDKQQNTQELPAHVEKGYDKAQAAVKLRQAHEEAVASGKVANAELLAAYMAYINLEEVIIDIALT
jgi:hypothetical protein